jgi:hypothetical protein
MKKMLRVLTFVVLIALVLMPYGAVSAKSTHITFTGSERCDPSTIKIKKEWTDAKGYHARGMTETCYDTADTPMMTGTDYLDLASVDIIDGQAKISGKIRIVTEEGGTWLANCKLRLGSDTIKCEGTGRGLYKGLSLKLDLTLEGPFTGTISGHKNK